MSLTGLHSVDMSLHKNIPAPRDKWLKESFIKKNKVDRSYFAHNQ